MRPNDLTTRRSLLAAVREQLDALESLSSSLSVSDRRRQNNLQAISNLFRAFWAQLQVAAMDGTPEEDQLYEAAAEILLDLQGRGLLTAHHSAFVFSNIVRNQATSVFPFFFIPYSHEHEVYTAFRRAYVSSDASICLLG